MTSHVQGMVVFNTHTSPTTYVPVADRVSPGFYYNTGSRWEKLMWGYVNWFYMPSISIPTTPTGTMLTVELYNEYRRQFAGTDPTTFKASQDAPATIPHIPNSGDLYYYVTYYDPTVITIDRIDLNGDMHYTVIGAVTDCIYINIVFVLK